MISHHFSGQPVSHRVTKCEEKRKFIGLQYSILMPKKQPGHKRFIHGTLKCMFETAEKHQKYAEKCPNLFYFNEILKNRKSKTYKVQTENLLENILKG